MKTFDDGDQRAPSPPSRKIEVRVAQSAADWRMAKDALGREHGLGAGSEAGDRLCQLVFEDGRLAAVLIWCAAAWHLQWAMGSDL